MTTFRHRLNDRRELLELLVLRGDERRPLEERNHVRNEVYTPSNDVDQRTVLSSIGFDVAASTKPRLDHAQHLSPVTVLADMKLRHQLVASTTRWIAVDADCEAALAVYITRNVAIQSFLLIVRTRHIVTLQSESVGTALYE